MAICVNNSFELIQRYNGIKSGRTRIKNGFSIEEPARKDILTNSKEDGATELLRKEHQGQTERDVSARQRFWAGKFEVWKPQPIPKP